MAIQQKLGLSVRLSQRLVLTPSLQQAIKLLPLTTLELAEVLEQEVSNVVQTTTSGIDSPTIQQRKIKTTVAVADGEILALGGLMQERDNLNRGLVPLAGGIPVIGNLFKNKTDRIERTELLVIIRPRVILELEDARAVTEEFRRRLNLDLRTSRRGPPNLKENVKRLLVR